MARITTFQRDFKVEMCSTIVGILFPEFEDILDEFKFQIRFKYAWVCIEARRPAHYYGIDTRTKKERKQGVKDPRELIEQSYHIDIGMTNHNQTPNLIWGKVSKETMQKHFHCVGFYFWNFNCSYGEGRKVTEEQHSQILTYLAKQGIRKPTVEEFYDHYYSD